VGPYLSSSRHSTWSKASPAPEKSARTCKISPRASHSCPPSSSRFDPAISAKWRSRGMRSRNSRGSCPSAALHAREDNHCAARWKSGE
jgi:hypothetical protein